MSDQVKKLIEEQASEVSEALRFHAYHLQVLRELLATINAQATKELPSLEQPVAKVDTSSRVETSKADQAHPVNSLHSKTKREQRMVVAVMKANPQMTKLDACKFLAEKGKIRIAPKSLTLKLTPGYLGDLEHDKLFKDVPSVKKYRVEL